MYSVAHHSAGRRPGTPRNRRPDRLDTILFSLEVLYESYNDGKFRPCPLLRKMIDAGLQGRKTGRGFYTYEMAQ